MAEIWAGPSARSDWRADWIKLLLHHRFLYKATLQPGWTLIPE
ncbi:MAG TPA: hypothetical protein VND96_02540 [Candidatus Micrarchaeaceae archaeon]|nr:hypothetical protein [Candidatus Micrarchaeaceae archaeon]